MGFLELQRGSQKDAELRRRGRNPCLRARCWEGRRFHEDVGMPCPCLPEEGDGGRSPLQPNGTPGCRLRRVQASHGTQTAARSLVFGRQARCSPSFASAGELGAMEPSSAAPPRKNRAREQSPACWAGFGVPWSPGVSRQSLELSVWVKSSEGPLGISSARVKHRPAGLWRHLPQQVWPQLTDKQEEGRERRAEMRSCCKPATSWRKLPTEAHGFLRALRTRLSVFMSSQPVALQTRGTSSVDTYRASVGVWRYKTTFSRLRKATPQMLSLLVEGVARHQPLVTDDTQGHVSRPGSSVPT